METSSEKIDSFQIVPISEKNTIEKTPYVFLPRLIGRLPIIRQNGYFSKKINNSIMDFN